VAGFVPAPEQAASAAVVIDVSSRHVTERVWVPGPHTVEQVLKAPVSHW